MAFLSGLEIPDLNSHGLTNLVGALVLAYLVLDKMGMIRRPKFLGKNGKNGKKGNPGNPGNSGHGLTPGERSAVYEARDGVNDLVEIVCAKDSKQRPIIFQQAEERHREVIECLGKIQTAVEALRE
ncbi:hypothetical protein LCGC14_0427480 [marine sediment metagenome]|uniref:Uncharacterized protein n=1 Tax=marine sediment metagenome TaxID=412755 RepID=A0A0F9VYE5_9ZZZZ